MKNHVLNTANAVLVVVFVCSLAIAQTAPQKAADSNTPQDPHDLSGVWLQKNLGPLPGTPRGGGGGRATAQTHLSQWVEGADPVLTPDGQKLMDEHKPSRGPRTVMPALQNDPQSGANPPGIIRTFIYGRPFENFMMKDSMVQLWEWYHMWRQIWTDGRKVPDWQSTGPYWYGYSVAKFVGNEFQVTTVGLDNRAWLDDWGTPFSEGIKLIEHWNRPDHDTLTLRLTIDDPMAYVQPWTTKQLTYKLQPKGSKDGELFEVIFAPIDEQTFNENVRDPGAALPTQSKK